MPLWIGNASLRLVATRELGDLGPSKTEPIVIEWRWYYHLPSLAIWIVVACLFVFVKENRNWQAGTILVPAILLAGVGWPLLVSWVPQWRGVFCFVPDEDQADFAFRSLIGAWTALWLMAPWLARRRISVAIICAMAFLLLFGVAAHTIAFSGALSVSPSTLSWLRSLDAGILWYGTTALALLLGLVFGAVACQDKLRPRRFLLWGLLGMLVAAFVGTSAEVYSLYFAMAVQGRSLPILLLILGPVVGSLAVAVFVFLVNLPFLYLACLVPCYRDRLRNILRLPDDR